MKEILNKLHLSIKEFAELYEIPYNTVRQWANEERKMPIYLKKLIEKYIDLKAKGNQLKIEDIEKNDTIYYGLRIITRESQWQRIYIDESTRDEQIEQEEETIKKWQLNRKIEKFKCIVLTN